MPWLEFTIEAKKDLAEAFEDFLLEQGAAAVTIQDLSDQAIFEPAIGTTPLWQLNKITGLFDTSLQEKVLMNAFSSRFAERAPKDFKLEALEDRDWEREWLKHYQSMCFGERLWVVPSEELIKPDDLPEELSSDLSYKSDSPNIGSPEKGKIVLRMDPGMAFGTGTHETTALCLEWLATNNTHGLTVVDYGCGSGILGIAAHLLGAQKVFGCDLDPQAITASYENAKRNDIKEDFIVENVDAFRKTIKDHGNVDIVIANILAGPLETLSEELSGMLGSGGKIVLSGILQEQSDSLVKSYERYFNNIHVEIKNDWVRLSATKS